MMTARHAFGAHRQRRSEMMESTPAGRAFTCLKVPERPAKPRNKGWTVPSDPGVGLRYQEDWLEAQGTVIDQVKFVDHTGLASHYPAEWLRRKMAIYRRHDIGVFTGGLSFELATLQGTQTAFLNTLKQVGFSGVEISDDVIDPMSPEQRVAAIRAARAVGLVVFTEVGRKHPEEPLEPVKVIDAIRRDLDTGALKVTLENSDAVLLARTKPDPLVQIVEAVGMENLIFEPQVTKPHIDHPELLLWLLRTFGPDINVMSVSFEDCSHISQMRSGLARETETEFLAVRRGRL
jgi:phosphosulfolactate synthase